MRKKRSNTNDTDTVASKKALIKKVFCNGKYGEKSSADYINVEGIDSISKQYERFCKTLGLPFLSEEVCNMFLEIKIMSANEDVVGVKNVYGLKLETDSLAQLTAKKRMLNVVSRKNVRNELDYFAKRQHQYYYGNKDNEDGLKHRLLKDAHIKNSISDVIILRDEMALKHSVETVVTDEDGNVYDLLLNDIVSGSDFKNKWHLLNGYINKTISLLFSDPSKHSLLKNSEMDLNEILEEAINYRNYPLT